MRPHDPTADLLAVVQWLSPAFPVGGFAHSHGLETALARGAVRDAASLAQWLDAICCHGAGRSDAILLALAHRDARPAPELAGWAAALAASAERWEETRAQGAAFLTATNALLGTAQAALPLPVAVGVQARRLDLPTAQLAALYLQAFAGNLVVIAARLLPLGQTEAQAALAGLGPKLAALGAAAAGAGIADLAVGTFGADLAALQHETQEVRLCRS